MTDNKVLQNFHRNLEILFFISDIKSNYFKVLKHTKHLSNYIR